MSTKCALVAKRANTILGHIKKPGQQVKGGDPPPLLCPGEDTFRILCPVLGSSVRTDRGHLEGVQWRATKVMRDLEHLLCEEKLRDLGPVQPGEE